MEWVGSSRRGGKSLSNSTNPNALPSCYSSELKGKDVRIVQGASGKEHGHVYNRAQHVTESTRHKYNTSHTHTFRGDQTREDREIVMISLRALMRGDENTTIGEKENKKYPNILCLCVE